MQRQQLSLAAGVIACTVVATTAAGEAAPRRPAPVHDQKQETAARAHFDRAEKAFNLGRFDEALAGYQAAYEELPLPAFLFNIAQCHRNVRNREQAVFFYQRYLSLAPDAPNRPVVEELIAEQKRFLAVQEEAEDPPQAPPAAQPLDLTARPAPAAIAATHVTPDKPAEPPSRWKSARWWLAGALGAAVIGGVILFAARGGSSGPSGSIGVIDGR